MPRKPKRPCGHTECPKLTDKYYCEEHYKLHAKQYNKFDRDPESAKRYSGSWRQIRARFLQANPLCEICQQRGKYTPATLVHHKQKLTNGGDNSVENLQAL